MKTLLMLWIRNIDANEKYENEMRNSWMKIWYNIERTFQNMRRVICIWQWQNVRALLMKIWECEYDKSEILWVWKVVILYRVMLVICDVVSTWHRDVWTELDSADLWIGLLGKNDTIWKQLFWQDNLSISDKYMCEQHEWVMSYWMSKQLDNW